MEIEKLLYFGIITVCIIAIAILIILLKNNENDHTSEISEKDKTISDQNKQISDKDKQISDKDKQIVSKSKVLVGTADITTDSNTIFNLPAYFGVDKIDCIFIVSYKKDNVMLVNVVHAFYYPKVGAGVNQGFTKNLTSPLPSPSSPSIEVSGDSGGSIFSRILNDTTPDAKYTISWTAIRL